MAGWAGPTEELRRVLTDARRRGFIAGGGIEQHLDHAREFSLLAGAEPARVLDLGSGAGLPGLVLAVEWASSRFWLLDSSHRRTAFLEESIARLGIAERVTVLCERAELAGRDTGLRGSFDVVVARSFGRPGVTAECGAPFLRVGGTLLVSEPPGCSEERWPAEELARIGLSRLPLPPTRHSFAAMRLTRPCPDILPRRVGVPSKRPLF